MKLDLVVPSLESPSGQVDRVSVQVRYFQHLAQGLYLPGRVEADLKLVQQKGMVLVQ